MSVAGDVNGDGVDDFIAGASGFDGNGSRSGKAIVISGADGAVIRTFVGRARDSRFGVAVAGAGDVDGDATVDLIVGAYRDGAIARNAGAAHVFSGRTGEMIYEFLGSEYGQNFGAAVAGAGDLNDDGFDDFLIVNPSEGLELHSGRSGELLHLFESSYLINIHPSARLAAGGDADGDGAPDILFSSGSGVVVYSGTSLDVLQERSREELGDFSTSSVAWAGDLNADGYDDYLVGVADIHNTSGAQRIGAYYAFSGFDGEELHSRKGEIIRDELGWTVSGVGDINRDGYDDYAVSSRMTLPELGGGTVTLHSGADGAELLKIEATRPRIRFGWGLAGGIDVNGDQIPDLAVSAYLADGNGADTGFVRLLSVVPCSDEDLDGYGDPASPYCPFADRDCDDSNPLRNPDAVEVCGNGIDDNCDGRVDVNDAQCALPAGCEDADGDGFSPDGGLCGASDCDDSNSDVHPGAREICLGGVDEDCDGQPFEGLGAACAVGLGACKAEGQLVCAPDGNGLSCDAVPGFPRAEICGNGIDDNCNGRVDGEDYACSPCVDLDGDGASTTGGACGPIDCDDTAPRVYPFGVEVCDGRDNDCDGAVDEGADQDSDGFDIVCGNDCDDGRSSVFPGAVELCNGRDDNCDGLLFPGLNDPCAGGPGACPDSSVVVCADDGLSAMCSEQIKAALIRELRGDTAGDGFGVSADIIGDLNADGFDEFIVGAIGRGRDPEFVGQATVHDGRGGEVLYRYAGRFEDDRFGVVSGLGDVDGDAIADFAVGSSSARDDDGERRGLVRVYSGATGEEIYTLFGDDSLGRIGARIDGVGDVDGDQRSDFVVGFRRFSPDPGLASVFSGATGVPLMTLQGRAPGDDFGATVSDAGDVDGDQVPDVAIGAHQRLVYSKPPGYVEIYSGATGDLIRSFDGLSGDDAFGVTLDNVGDLNGDGFPELIVGATDANVDEGYARVFSGIDGSVLFDLRGDGSQERFGDVAGIGDVNNDGVADFAIGAAFSDLAGDNTGVVRVYSGANAVVLTEIFGKDRDDQLGIIAGGGDVDGDGVDDLILSTPQYAFSEDGTGEVYVYSLAPCVDLDCDGYGVAPALANCAFPEPDCDDADPTLNAGNPEVCDNGVDDDCDGLVDGADGSCSPCLDLDGDGYSFEGGDCGPVDCRDDDPARHPGAAEICNWVDDDCDGLRFPGLGDACAVGVGACARSGLRRCTADAAGAYCDAVAGEPGTEVCNDVDD
ncbi:MAG: FG-GAP repeat protein, partial [Myxococcales bacterium]|nr:FG-GAP repeat protein [Myxococcales bacterium]